MNGEPSGEELAAIAAVIAASRVPDATEASCAVPAWRLAARAEAVQPFDAK